MAYDRIPGVDENYRFPPEVEGGVEQAMLDKAASHVQATVPNKMVKTNGQGMITTNTPWSAPQIAPKSYVDSRVPVNLPITEDNSVGKRIFIGDTMVHGDTGWRRIDETHLLNGWAFSTVKTFMLRRINSEVVIVIPGLSLTGENATADGFYTLPSGFQNYNGGNYGEVGSLYSSGNTISVRKDFSELRANHRSSLNGMLNWFTSSAWPTSLPGIPF